MSINVQASNNVPAAKSSSQYIRNIGVHENVMPLIKVQPENLKKIDSKSILSTIKKYKQQQAEEELELERQKATKKQSASSSSIGSNATPGSSSKGRSKRKRSSMSSANSSAPTNGYDFSSSVTSINSAGSISSLSASRSTPNYTSSVFTSDPISWDNNRMRLLGQSSASSDVFSEIQNKQTILRPSVGQEGCNMVPQGRLQNNSFSGTSQPWLNEELLPQEEMSHPSSISAFPSTARLNSLEDLTSVVSNHRTLIPQPQVCSPVYSISNIPSDGLQQPRFQYTANPTANPLVSSESNEKIVPTKSFPINQGYLQPTSSDRFPSISSYGAESPMNYKDTTSSFSGFPAGPYPYPNQNNAPTSSNMLSLPTDQYYESLDLNPICNNLEKSLGETPLYANSNRSLASPEIPMTNSLQEEVPVMSQTFSMERMPVCNLEIPVQHKFLSSGKSNLEQALDDIYFEYMQTSNGFIHSNYASTSGGGAAQIATEFSTSTSVLSGDGNCDEVNRTS